MDGEITQNNSRAELVRSGETESSAGGNNRGERTLRDVKFKEWIIIFILCFVNLINYMDRFTLAGKSPETTFFFLL